MTTALQVMRRNTTDRLRAEMGQEEKPLKITLPWPPRDLHSNAREHWAAKARITKSYKTDCWYLFMEHRHKIKGKTKFALTFCPPDNRRRDMDGMESSFKAGIDALSIATGVDDYFFEFEKPVRGDPVSGGAVIVEVVE
jgi:crossover junction endodeoxyribonuclease RusA